MKIIRVKANSLFGVFNHDIPLNEENGITIIIGENGLGKTIILESISALFDQNYTFFNSLEFESFIFYFNNGEVWQLTKDLTKENIALFISRDSSSKPVQKLKPHKIYQSTDKFTRKALMRDRERISRMKMELELNRKYHSVSEEYFFNNQLDIDYNDIQELQDFHNIQKMSSIRRHIRMMHESDEDVNPPKWFTDGIEKIKVKLIETQRLITAKERGSDSYVNNLNKCSNEIKQMIAVVLRKSSLVATTLDSTYPNRLVQKLKQGSHDSFEDLNIALAKLAERRKTFSSSGLVVKIADSELLQIDEKQKNLVNVLKLYIDDSHEKLEPFEELSNKIILFKNIINKRFKHKKLEITPDEGLLFRSTVVKNTKMDFEYVPPSKLSSGEQNELILFYKLIFNSQKNDMILIDEPELSLHISWQNKFITDLKEVTSINDVSIVIATHSPDIIDENWNLKVELLGVE